MKKTYLIQFEERTIFNNDYQEVTEEVEANHINEIFVFLQKNYHNVRNLTIKELPKIKETNQDFEKIRQWSMERELHKAEPSKQMMKLIEELGELSKAIIRGDYKEMVDGLGDSLVVLIILAQQLGIPLEVALESAYEEIKNRNGEMKNGVFVKDSDLIV